MYFFFYKCIARKNVAHSISKASLSNSNLHIFKIIPTTLYPFNFEPNDLTMPLLKKCIA